MIDTASTSATFAAAPKPEDYKALIDLLAVLGEANRMLAEMETRIERGYLELVADARNEYTRIQTTIGENEAALEVIARRNPQWFAAKKNVTTPYGVVKFKASTELVCADEEEAIRRVLRARRPRLLHREIKLNRALLAELSDDELAKFGIVRKAKENLTVETKTIDLGKAVKTTGKSPKATAATARKAAELTGSNSP